MKSNKLIITSILLAVLIAFGALPVTAAETTENDSEPVSLTIAPPVTEAESDEYDVEPSTTAGIEQPVTEAEPDENNGEAVAAGTELYVTARDIETNGFKTAVQNALDTARDRSTDKRPYTITVEPGEYELFGTLNLYSNTTLFLNGVTIRRGWQGNNIMRLGPNTLFCDAGVEGYYYRNIRIEGGTIDGNYLEGTMIKLAHAKNLTIQNTVFQNCSNSHIMEVAGIAGFTLSGCSFLNQLLDVTRTRTYEAVQLDVLKSGNFTEYRSEDLCMKNVLVENCVFNNVPRGVGSHTSVYNNPHRNITVRNCSFKDISSAAIQSLSWSGCTITGNRIDNATRGIALYVIDTGTFLASELAEEGHTTQHIADDFQTQKCNAVVTDNTITNSGLNADPYASYERSAISTIGTVVSSGKLPQGTYPFNTAVIKNNFIELKGNGIRVEFGKNVTVEGNVVVHRGNSGVQSDYGIVSRNSTTNLNVIKNYISNPPLDGIRTITNCSSNKITSNEVIGAGQYGISVMEGSAVTGSISKNKVSQSKTGIYVKRNSSANSVVLNTCHGCNNPFSVAQTIGTNFTSNKVLKSFTFDVPAISLVSGEHYLLGKSTNPINSITNYVYSSSDPNVASVDEYGRITAENTGISVITATSDNGNTALCSVYVNTHLTPVAPVLSLSNTAEGLLASWDQSYLSSYFTVYYKTAFQSDWSCFDTDSTSALIPGAESGTLYSVKVQGVSAEGESGCFSDEKSLTYIACTTITSLTFSGSNRLSWNPVNGANKYQIARKKSGEADTYFYSDVNSYIEKRAVVDTVYTYQVRAMYQTENNDTVYGAWSASKSVTTIAAPTVRLSNNSNGIRAEWNIMKGAVRYIVYFKALTDKNWSSISTNKNNYTLSSAKEGVKYAFQVRPIGSRVNGPYSKVQYIVFNNPVKIKPALTLTKQSNGILAKWDVISSATQYILYYRSATDTKWSSVTVSGTSYTFTKAVRGKTYYLQLQTLFGSTKGAFSYVQTMKF